jgi:hypothetical protein
MKAQSQPAHFKKVLILFAASLVVAMAAGACDPSSSPGESKGSKAASKKGCIEPENGSGCLPVAPAASRVDLAEPVFSAPASITNPLHPSSKVPQVIYGGQVDGKPFRTEFTLLPQTKKISVNGEEIDAVTMQYLAFSNGRILEVALDWFAQADSGAVWYLGEDVVNYEDGAVADTEGSWQAGKDGPAAMIMPASPKVGDVYRPENIPGFVFEEVTVKSVGQTVTGPSGPVSGAITVSELHMDGSLEDKTFAPGYGEFATGTPDGDQEIVSFAVPTDARPGPIPAPLTALSDSIRHAFDVTGRNDWKAADTAGAELAKAWEAYRSDVPEVLRKQVDRDLESLRAAISARKQAQAHEAALRVAQDGLDLRLRYEPVATVDLARLELWGRQLVIDSADANSGAVLGDATTLGWTMDRVRHTLDAAAAPKLDDLIANIRKAAEQKDFGSTSSGAAQLLAFLGAI